MSFLHTHSCECLKSELHLFTLLPTQTSIESPQWIHYKPVSSLMDDAPVEFVVPGHGEEYIDLAHTMLSLCIRVETETGAGAAAAKVGPVNHILYSMFNQIDVYFNQKLVSPLNNAYAYRAYIQALLNYASSVKTSYLASCLWYSNTAGNMNALPGVTPSNHGLDKRGTFVQGRTLDLIDHLHCDVFNQDKFLINGVEVRMREDYPAGYTLFAFDLTPDLSANCEGQWNLMKHDSLRMEVRFERALTTTVNCLVYAEFESVLEIDSSHQVIVDYSG
ncbi:uncharacterized protein F54H12.2-like [Harpegnathos saltator]|uniref:uncharacterized protein F54H12.2-like n=1 Tax=Harpegnathos saltator TaxID=610380 RepID=UPI000DBEE04E|nr:uncharacterized protein F54H12.2-like [Harpegnathos saltator]